MGEVVLKEANTNAESYGRSRAGRFSVGEEEKWAKRERRKGRERRQNARYDDIRDRHVNGEETNDERKNGDE